MHQTIVVGSIRGGDPVATPIADGKISGDTFSFTTTQSFGGNEFKSTYNGKVSGDKIELGLVPLGSISTPRGTLPAPATCTWVNFPLPESIEKTAMLPAPRLDA